MKLTLAPAVWLAHFTFVYVVASVACERLAMATAAATLAALAVYAGAALTDRRRLHDPANGPSRFVARTHLALCALSALATLWVAYPAFVLPACAS